MLQRIPSTRYVSLGQSTTLSLKRHHATTRSSPTGSRIAPSSSPPPPITNALAPTLANPSRTPIVLIHCGSFNPLTYLHLRTFELATDHARTQTDYEVVGRIISPVSDAYGKKGLLEAKHRSGMCRRAVEELYGRGGASHPGDVPVSLDLWEAAQTEYTPTARVLDRFDREINAASGGVGTAEGERRSVGIRLLGGADLLESLKPPAWSEEDIEHILRRYGVWAVERQGADVEDALERLKQYRGRIEVIEQNVLNDISSTKIRSMIERGLSIRHLVPDAVWKYIRAERLYQDQARPRASKKT
ncbi:hypothetical protein LTR28_011640 [Elasticomyces elasticus]|nr:hypothetical protein LTR28_011640 [Elasticomyces elasticus]